MPTFLLSHGMAPDVVQLLLGPADPRTTQLYSRSRLARTAYDKAMAALVHEKTAR